MQLSPENYHNSVENHYYNKEYQVLLAIIVLSLLAATV